MIYSTAGSNLISVRGNLLRSIILHLAPLERLEVSNWELKTGIPIVHTINRNSSITNK